MKKGFTLIEVLVVFVIITLISTILIVNWRKNEKRYLVKRVAQEIVQNIRKAQDMSLNSYEHEGVVPDYSYGIYFDNGDQDKYMLFGDLNRNNTYQPSDIEIGEYLMETGTKINSLSSGVQDLNITFSIPDGFTNIEPSASSATITITKDDGTSGVDIVILQTGQVNVQ